MPKAESIFWGMAIVAGLYLLSGWDRVLAGKVNTQLANAGLATAQEQQTAPAAGGHFMPNGEWMADSAMGGGGGCGMHGGGGCGCGH